MDGGEQWRNCSPGLQVTADVMKWSLLQGLKYFDFTIGMLPYKLEFGAAPSSLFEICEARSIRGNIILCWDRATARVKAWLQHYPRVFGAVRATRRVLDRLRAKRDRNEKD
jgi:CelD/BcsL family acetyltransferase involved in cellulose biosynthesis